MKKYFLSITFLSIVAASCNNNGNGPLISDGTGTDTVNAAANNTGKAALLELSAKELEDDSVFADGTKPATWAVAGIKNVKGFKLFLKQVKEWVATDNKDELSRVVLYPVADASIENRKMFVDNYYTIFTKELKATIKEAKLNQVFRNYRGAMIADGKLWFAQMDEGFKIIAINPPNLADWGLMPAK